MKPSRCAAYFMPFFETFSLHARSKKAALWGGFFVACRLPAEVRARGDGAHPRVGGC
jgi:hypothetical protein